MNEYSLEMRDITKSFPGVLSLDNVSFNVKAGEVHVLMGENGAGKSTLMKILAGIYHQDSGEILIEGKKVYVTSPRQALQYGISMIHQELNPIPHMTVAENIFLGREPKASFGRYDSKKLNMQASELLAKLGLEINPRSEMAELSIAEKQMIEIVKAISYNSKIIIMDEPTSAITDNEVEKLFQSIRLLKAGGVSIIYISHKMNEIFRIADRITVLRDGQYIDTREASLMDENTLITMMVGREIKNIFNKQEVALGAEVMSVKNLTKKGLFENVSLNVRSGEILGVAGLMGAGRTELVETIFGIHIADEGEVYIRSEKMNIRSPRNAIKHGIAMISEDRKIAGLNLKGSVKENISIVNLKEYCRNGRIEKKKENKAVDEQIKKLSIKTTTRDQLTMFLSGGNQQKVVISKWLLSDCSIIILDEPTRGIDVGAKAEIYALMTALVKEGKAIIMVSSELPEIIGMSDRVIIMHEGRKTGELSKVEMNQEKIMSFATGRKEVEADENRIECS
jgi:inositol transport system ATP-binding protein